MRESSADRAPLLTIRTRQREDRVHVTVTDNGPGIPEEIRGSLFDLFVKGTIAPGHFGLGLYKAKLAVEQLGGSLDYQSEPDQGTTFKVEFEA